MNYEHTKNNIAKHFTQSKVAPPAFSPHGEHSDLLPLVFVVIFLGGMLENI
jgi:hypothetical protein